MFENLVESSSARHRTKAGPLFLTTMGIYFAIFVAIVWASIMFFDPRLIHRSGRNTSDHTRMALVGCYTATDGLKVPKPVFEWRGKSPRGWLDEQL